MLRWFGEVPFLFILMRGPISASALGWGLSSTTVTARQYCNGGSLAEQIWHDGNSQTPKDQMPTEQAAARLQGSQFANCIRTSEIWHFLLDILLGLQHLHRRPGRRSGGAVSQFLAALGLDFSGRASCIGT